MQTSRHPYVAHYTPGRLRIKIPGATTSRLREVADTLINLPSVKDVKTRVAAQSVIVTYAPHMHEYFVKESASTFDEQGKMHLPGWRLMLNSLVETVEAEFSATELSLIMQTVHELFSHTNKFIKFSTRNAVDLQLLVPLTIAISGLLIPRRSQSTPRWLTIAIFASNLVLSLNKPHRHKF